MKLLKIVFVALFFGSSANAAWIVKKSGDGQITVVRSEQSFTGEKVLRSIKEFIAEGASAPPSGTYEETLYGDNDLPEDYKLFLPKETVEWTGAEVRTLVLQGSVENRIDLTIVGDGYTESEKQKFFDDAERTKNDLFGDKTFASYLPLFNVHAVFVPSKESGLTDVIKKNTALGLYRSPPGSKRAIMPGNTPMIEKALAMAPGADYPILIANDEFYGGLGGRYAISTSSARSGKVVLRHELGHNFGEVGEEYDGGSVYDGANASHSANVTWSHWVESSLDVFETRQLSGDYVWQNLNGRPYQAKFNFPSDSILDVIVSAVGWSTEDDVHVFIDGQKHNLVGEFTNDRSFFNVDTALSAGSHLIEAREQMNDKDNVLAFIRIFALPSNIIKEKGHIGAYATFDELGNKSYRPTFDTCIMRDMTSDEFCSVDKENFWHKFLSRISILDTVKVDANSSGFVVEAVTPPLEGLNYTWYRLTANGPQKILNPTHKLMLGAEETGNYRVEVQFQTSEVRKYNSNFAVVKDFTVAR